MTSTVRRTQPASARRGAACSPACSSCASAPRSRLPAARPGGDEALGQARAVLVVRVARELRASQRAPHRRDHRRADARRRDRPAGPRQPRAGARPTPIGGPSRRRCRDGDPGASAGAKEATPSFSSTNVQEAGIDEPDIVKTDGKRVFAIADGKLYALDAGDGAPKLVGSLDARPARARTRSSSAAIACSS